MNGHLARPKDGSDKTDGDAVSHIRSLTDSGNSRIPPLLFEIWNNALRVYVCVRA